MAYANAQRPQNRATAIAAVVGIHAGLGALLIYGLATNGVIKPVVPPLVGEQFALPPPPPPPEPVDQPKEKVPESSREVFAPKAPIDFTLDRPIVDSTDKILPPSDPVPKATPDPLPKATPPAPPPAPAFDPMPPRPSNSQSGWVTQADYRSSWISRGYTGQVGYRLSVGASGRVEGCSVTRSSGVSALDQATCQLVSRRARFDPAKNDQGRATAGTYTGAVLWQLPD